MQCKDCLRVKACRCGKHGYCFYLVEFVDLDSAVDGGAGPCEGFIDNEEDKTK